MDEVGKYLPVITQSRKYQEKVKKRVKKCLLRGTCYKEEAAESGDGEGDSGHA